MRPDSNGETQRSTHKNGGQNGPTHVHHAPPAPFVAAPLLLVALGTIAPFALQTLDAFLTSAAASISGAPVHKHAALWHGFTPALLTSLLAIAAGVWLFLNRSCPPP